MPTFVVSVRLPDALDEEFVARIPRHRAFVNQLLAEHVMETYAVSADRGRGWMTVHAENEASVRALVGRLPLFEFYVDVEIDELFIFDSSSARFPAISLN